MEQGLGPYEPALARQAPIAHVRWEVEDEAGRVTRVGIVAGSYGEATPPAPPPDSWASQPDADVAIWTIKMEPHATWALPAARSGTNRTLYFFAGAGLRIGSQEVPAERLVELRPDVELPLRSGDQPIEMLLLQGRPIGEPVVQHGPFVMNSREEIVQALRDYQRTRFGGWPWSRHDQVHGSTEGRFARHADGREERPA